MIFEKQKIKHALLVILMLVLAYLVFLFQSSIPMLGKINLSQAIIAGLVSGSIYSLLFVLGLVKGESKVD